MIRYEPKRVRVGVAVWLAAGLAGAQAQQSRPVPTSMPTIPYADYTFGFEMRIPAGWDYDRTRFMGPEGAIGLLRGGVGSATLQILVFPKAERISFADWVRHFESQLAGISGTLRIEGRQRRLGARTAAVLVVDARLGAERTRTQYLCVPFDPTKIWVFSYAAVVAAPDQSAALAGRFEQLVASLRVLYDPAEAREMSAAFERGQALVARLGAEPAERRVPEAERYYDVIVKDKPVGFFLRRVTRESRSLDDPRYGKRGRPGVRVHEESWRFAADGAVRVRQVDLFSSFDLRTELVETRTTQVPASGQAAQRLFISLDQCVREGDLLFSSFSTNLDVGLPEPRLPIQVGDTYLSLAWVRLLPAVLGNAAGPPYAFAVYDPETRALSTSTIRPLGPQPLPDEPGTRVPAFETSEGFARSRGRLYTDASGLLLRYEAGDLVLRRSSAEAVARRWGARRDAARARMESRRR